VNTNRELVTIQRASELASVSRRTIYNWINENKVDYVRTAGGSIRIIADTLFRAKGATNAAVCS
jgi:excisionase family DNA binding protein